MAYPRGAANRIPAPHTLRPAAPHLYTHPGGCARGFTVGNRQNSHACPLSNFKIFFKFGRSLPSPPAAFAMNREAEPAFIHFVLTQELQTFINSKGVDRVARAAVQVLDRVEEAGGDKEEWQQIREASGFPSDDSELQKAISAYAAAHAKRIDIRSAEFRPLADGVGWPRRDVMLVTLDQNLIKELSIFVAVVFQVFLSAVDGLILAKASTGVGLKMAMATVEKNIVRDMIPTMSEDVGFTD